MNERLIVSMVVHQGDVLIATQNNIYKLVGDHLEKIEFEFKDDPKREGLSGDTLSLRDCGKT